MVASAIFPDFGAFHRVVSGTFVRVRVAMALSGLAAWEAAIEDSYGEIQQSIGMAHTAEELVRSSIFPNDE